MKRLLAFLLLPAFAWTQEVTPVLSKDYLTLINQDSLHLNNTFRPDTMNSISRSSLNLSGYYGGNRIRKISIQHGFLNIEPAHEKTLFLSGNVSTSIEIKRINRLPALQNEYVQGRSQNGALVWRGPETNEVFSYGPAINTVPAESYDNSIFRTASQLSQSLNMRGRYLVSGKQVLNASVKVGQTRENTFIPSNKNNSKNFSTSLETLVKWLTITGGYTFLQDEFSNSNRNGFLNRVYQNATLTPVSFSNDQNSTAAVGQRSYSNQADNPLFLLHDNGNRFFQTHRTGSLVLERRLSPLRFKVLQSVENLYQNNNEGYKPETAFFPNGIFVNRIKNDVNYFLQTDASYTIPFTSYQITGVISTGYSYANDRSGINYSNNTAWRYQRSAHNASLTYSAGYRDNNFETGVNLTDKLYVSNTTTSGNYFLPSVSGFVRFDRIFNSEYLSAKLNTSLSSFNNELPINQSFSQSSLLQYTTEQAFQFFPVTEVAGFDNLAPVHHKEWTGRMELNYKGKLTLYGEVFNRNTFNDIFPVFEGGKMLLRNIADHRNNGVELGLSFNSYTHDLITDHTISFFAVRSKVTNVADGYDFTPVAGFSNIHKAIVKGAALGSIVGASYLRDANNNILIGNDGFPLVNTTPSVIGNPVPDFVMKMSNNINWKKLYLNIDWEWKKGGQVWNGTQAVLDYYGRSATTAALRNTTGYVFNGMLQDKQKNTIPVSFYDASQPVEKNRWTRYGQSGVGEEYIQKGDYLRLNNISLSYKQRFRKHIQQLVFAVYANNIIIWTAYKGADPNQLLYDQPNSTGLDFFNLPSTKVFGCNISIQF